MAAAEAVGQDRVRGHGDTLHRADCRLVYRPLGEATLRWHTLDLEVISVPKRVAEQGFTGQVVTQRLREGISTVLDQAQITMAKTSADVPDRSAVEHAVPRRRTITTNRRNNVRPRHNACHQARSDPAIELGVESVQPADQAIVGHNTVAGRTAGRANSAAPVKAGWSATRSGRTRCRRRALRIARSACSG